jgi:hypothetical protein
MARKWKATTGKKFLAALRRAGWTLTQEGEFIKATRAGLSHDITFGPDDTLRASLAEMWGSWLGIKPEDLD